MSTRAKSKNLRIKPIYELSILRSFLHKTQLESDHDVHKAGEHGFLFRSDHLAIDLYCATCYPSLSLRKVGQITHRTNRRSDDAVEKWGEFEDQYGLSHKVADVSCQARVTCTHCSCQRFV
jgi:hypothetical protein